MQEHPTDPDQPRGESVVPARSGRLAGAFCAHELDERERAHWHLIERATRQANYVRAVAAAALLLVVVGLFVSWRSLRSATFHAEKHLKRIRMELDFQKTLVLPQASLNSEHNARDADGRRTLADASVDLQSSDLGVRVRAIPIVQRILTPRIHQAKAQMKTNYPALARRYERDLDSSEQTITDRKQKYNLAAAEYNREVKRFPSSLFHRPLGYPNHLAALK